MKKFLKALSALIFIVLPVEDCCDGAVAVQVGELTKVTAYCPCEKCCGKWSDGYTASGHKINYGDRFVAADANIPFGTMLIVPNYNDSKPVAVLDRGGTITGNHIDVYFDRHDEALEWGVQWLEIKKVKK